MVPEWRNCWATSLPTCAPSCASLFTLAAENSPSKAVRRLGDIRRFGTSRVCVACVRVLALVWSLWTCVLGTSGWRRARQGISTGNAHGGLSPWPLPLGAFVSFSDLSRGGYLARACRAEGSVPLCAWGSSDACGAAIRGCSLCCLGPGGACRL